MKKRARYDLRTAEGWHRASKGEPVMEPTAKEYEFPDGLIVLSVQASYGAVWHTILQRHITEHPGGPDSKIYHIATHMTEVFGDEEQVHKLAYELKRIRDGDSWQEQWEIATWDGSNWN